MADGAFSSIGGLPSANICWFHQLISLAADIGFKCRLDLERPLLGIVHEEKEMQTFSSAFGEEALLLDGFLSDIDLRNNAINQSRLLKNQTFIPHLHGALRTT